MATNQLQYPLAGKKHEQTHFDPKNGSQAASGHLPEIWLPVGSGLGNYVPSGSVKVRAEWRPLVSRWEKMKRQTIELIEPLGLRRKDTVSLFEHVWTTSIVVRHVQMDLKLLDFMLHFNQVLPSPKLSRVGSRDHPPGSKVLSIWIQPLGCGTLAAAIRTNGCWWLIPWAFHGLALRLFVAKKKFQLK